MTFSFYTLHIQFPIDFEKRYNEYKNKPLGSSKSVPQETADGVETASDQDILSVQLKVGLLKLNRSTGFVNFNKVETTLNPTSKEFNVLLKLMANRNYHATYKNLLGDNVSKTSKRTLGFVVRNLKEALGILPIQKAKNKNCIENIKGYGYKLIT